MISEVAKEGKAECGQGFVVSPVHADIIAHISLTRTKLYCPNLMEMESSCVPKRERNGICQAQYFLCQVEMWALTQEADIKDTDEKLGA